MPRHRFLPFAFIALASACASSGVKRGTPVEVAYREPLKGRSIELVNSSHTDRLALYSATRADANRKVASDEVVQALLERFDEQGFDRFAVAGDPAGDQPTLYVDVGGARRALVLEAGDSDEEKLVMQACLRSFFDIYTNVYALQTVEVSEGEDPFAVPQTTPGRRR